MSTPELFEHLYGQPRPDTVEGLVALIKGRAFAYEIEVVTAGLQELYEQAQAQGLVDKTYFTAYMGNNPSNAGLVYGSIPGRSSFSNEAHPGKGLLDGGTLGLRDSDTD